MMELMHSPRQSFLVYLQHSITELKRCIQQPYIIICHNNDLDWIQYKLDWLIRTCNHVCEILQIDNKVLQPPN